MSDTDKSYISSKRALHQLHRRLARTSPNPHQAWTAALAITDEASPLALRSIRNRLSTAMHRRCQSLGVEACGTVARVFVPWTTTQGSLPEICQKLPYTQPHVPARRRLQQHGSSWGLRGDVRLRGGPRTTRASMACKGSGVQIPS